MQAVTLPASTRTATIAEKDEAIRMLREACGDYVMRVVSGMASGSSFLRMQEALSETEKFEGV